MNYKGLLRILLLCLTLTLSVNAVPATTAKAGAVSTQELFQKGNACYKQCDYPHAMLYYMRAHKMKPLNDDISHNINITCSKTIDKMPAESNVFFVDWYRGLVMANTIDTWATVSVVSLIASLLLFLAYLFVDSLTVRKLSFYACCILFLSFSSSLLFAWNRKHILNTHDTAVVTTDAVHIRNLPAPKAAETAVIHEGTCVRITDTDIKDWYGIRLSDGREGWIKVSDVELI